MEKGGEKSPRVGGVGVGGRKENKFLLRKIGGWFIGGEMVPPFCFHYFLPFFERGSERIGGREENGRMLDFNLLTNELTYLSYLRLT